jgi:hypothetical protein
MWLPNSPWTWSFALIAIAQAIIALAIEGYVFAQFEVNLLEGSRGTSASHSIPTYLALFIFGFLYQLVLVYDALRAKNTIQVIGLCLYNVGMVIYSGVQIAQVKEAIDGLIYPQPNGGPPQIDPNIWNKLHWFLLACPCIIALGTVLLSGVAWKLYHEFAWTIYKNISADLRLKRRYLTFQVSRHIAVLTHVAPLTTQPDLHRPPQVRFLLLPRLYSAVPRHRRLQLHRLRILPNHRRRSRNGVLPALRSLRHPPRILHWPSDHGRRLPSRYGLLHLQARAHVRQRRYGKGHRISTRTQSSNSLCRHYHLATSRHHRDSLRVHAQLQQRSQASHPKAQSRQPRRAQGHTLPRRRRFARAFITPARSFTKSDDDRLRKKLGLIGFLVNHGIARVYSATLRHVEFWVSVWTWEG